MITVQLQGIDALREQLQGFSDRRLRAAVATAITRTAVAVRSQWRQQLQADLDRPERLTLAAPISTLARADTMTATVSLRDQMRGGNGAISPAEYIATQELGGDRRLRKFERALVAAGAMPAGSRAVPGEGAALDGYGNVRRQQIVQVLNQLAGGVVVDGYRRVISGSAAKRTKAAGRAGRAYFAVPVRRGSGLPAGIYARGTMGKPLRAVFFFVSGVRYPRRTNLVDAARRIVGAQANLEVKRAIDQHLARLAAKASRA